MKTINVNFRNDFHNVRQGFASKPFDDSITFFNATVLKTGLHPYGSLPLSSSAQKYLKFTTSTQTDYIEASNPFLNWFASQWHLAL